MKKVISVVCALLCSTILWGADPLNFKNSQSSSIGIYISDISTGKVLVRNNDVNLFIPASVQKCVTAATAQLMLDAGFTFTTRIEARGDLKGGVLEGNLYVVGSGDPTLGSRFYKGRQSISSAVVDWVQALGVDSIAGDIVMDCGQYPSIGVSPYWLLEDLAWEYGAGFYGINYKDNSFSMTVRTNGDCTGANGIVDVVNFLKRGRKADVMAMRGEGSKLLTLTGTIGAEPYTSRYSLPSPSSALYNDLMSALNKSGIRVRGESIDDKGKSVECLTYRSPARDDILKIMMHKSDNLFAEGMLRAVTADSEKTYECAIEIEKGLWSNKGVDISTLRWVDGSGLSPVNRMSPRTLGTILEYMARSGGIKSYLNLFPLAGKEGTVRSLLVKTRLEGRLALKSGSMNGVLCYAGYKLDSTGIPSHVVVVMVNGAVCPFAEIRAAISRYLLTVF